MLALDTALLLTKRRLRPSCTRAEIRTADSYGRVYFRADRVLVVFPWEHDNALDASPHLLLIDESTDSEQELFALGGLVLSVTGAIALAMNHIVNLVRLRHSYPGLWPPHQAPPRLHLRDFGSKPRMRTSWSQLPPELLLEVWVNALRQAKHVCSAPPFIAPVDLGTMERAMSAAAGRLPTRPAVHVPDLSLQIAAFQLRIALHHRVRPEVALEVVTDYDATMIVTGPQRRQATLRFMDH